MPHASDRQSTRSPQGEARMAGEEEFKEVWSLALHLSKKLEEAGIEHDVEMMHALREEGYGWVDDEGNLAPYPDEF